ncbi:MAG: DUF1573 domain-containing protein [Planctomycetales bacterium]|nr:DUF1573 domain-containing protein [Planctomycetales bacterium]
MKTGTLIGIVLFAAASVAGAVWVFRTAPPDVNPAQSGTTATTTAGSPKAAGKNNSDECPPLPAKGEPAAKAVISETEFKFGTMEAYQQKSHTFVIRNDGEAPLLIKKGKVSCKCTMSTAEDKPIPPGKSTDILLEWKPLMKMEDWSQTAEFCTNDPDPKMRKVVLTVRGDVVERLSVTPRDIWQLGELLENKPAQVVGTVYSMTLEKFAIKKVTATGTSAIKTSWKPIAADELTPLKAKSGYQITLDAGAGLPAGSFSFPVKIETDVKEVRDDGVIGPEVTLNLEVTGSRNGPFTFQSGAAANRQANWINDRRLIALERFEELKGGRRGLPFYVRNCPADGLQFLSQTCDCSSKALKLSLEPIEPSKGKFRGYMLIIDYPPGPDKNLPNDGGNIGCRVRLKTNHPDAPEFDLLLYYTIF